MSTPAMPRPGVLRVLQVCARFPPDLGGVETHVAEVCRRLAPREDLQLGVLTTDRSGHLPPFGTTAEGVPIQRVRAYPKGGDYYVAPGLVPAIRTGDWDLVHVQGVHTAVPVLAMTAALQARIPYVVTFHTGGHTSSARVRLRGLQWRTLAPLLRRSRKLIPVGRFEQRLFQQVTGLDSDRFALIRNGGGLPSDPDPAARVPGRIVSCGRLEWYKGHHRAIEALAVLRDTMPEAHLHILGAGPIEAELRAAADRLGVSHAVSIRFIPPTERAAMARELNEASAMLALSDYEAHPVAVMETLALGVPVVGYEVAGIGDLVEDGTVRGVPVGAEPDVVARELVAALAAPRAQSHPELPTWEQAADRLHEVYRQAAGKPPRRADVLS
jgi:glycosyltransferase involved in cell wall biosynthesis